MTTLNRRDGLPGRVACSVADWLDTRRDHVIDELEVLVTLESPTRDTGRLIRAADHVATRFSHLGSISRHEPGPELPPHLQLDVNGAGSRLPLLVLCHYDTVWPAGTIDSWPFTVKGDVAAGPGVLDMKASIVVVHEALTALRSLGVELKRGARVLVTADEEIGNPTSRTLVTALAERASAALVMEPPLADGRLKTQRKGQATVRVAIQGRSAHAGVDPNNGVSAATEAAHVALAANALADDEAGTIVNVGVIEAGDLPNVVAPSARLEIEVRADTDAEVDRVIDALRRLQPRVAGARLAVSVGSDRPAMRRVPETDRLLCVAREVGAALGCEIGEGATGGVSEGNFTQAAGTPTLDGLGVQGEGAHTPEERISLSSLFMRTALLAGVMVALDDCAE